MPHGQLTRATTIPRHSIEEFAISYFARDAVGGIAAEKFILDRTGRSPVPRRFRDATMILALFVGRLGKLALVGLKRLA